MVIDELKELLYEFLNRWTIENIEHLTIQQYVGLRNKDTFCQWVETKTRRLGSIKGMTSIKFGIYERKDSNKKPKNYENNDKYSWLKCYGKNKELAFKNVKNDIIKIIKLSELGRFSEIDNIKLPDLFKWKVAFLYSNERLIPIYKRDVLFKIANHYNFPTDRNTTISEIQNVMILNKPAHLDVYAYMWQLFNKFGLDDEKNVFNGENTGSTSRRTRKFTKTRNTTPQLRTVTRSYVAEQKHNKIQEALVKILSKEYGGDNVILEENFVDIKLIQPEYINFYEVKSSSYASECIKEALGQILLYSFYDSDERKKNHIVVGQYPPTQNDRKYIDFIKQNLKLNFDYIYVEIE